ncbi:MAG: hypothetical protein AB1717_07265, partial [Pseudomonadota bacterium]
KNLSVETHRQTGHERPARKSSATLVDFFLPITGMNARPIYKLTGIGGTEARKDAFSSKPLGIL